VLAFTGSAVVNWSAVVEAVHSLGLECRLKGRKTGTPGEWTNFLIEPTKGYIESRCGPISYSEIEWLLINPFKTTFRGRLVPPVVVDVSEQLTALLDESGARYLRNAQGFVVRGGES